MLSEGHSPFSRTSQLPLVVPGVLPKPGLLWGPGQSLCCSLSKLRITPSCCCVPSSPLWVLLSRLPTVFFLSQSQLQFQGHKGPGSRCNDHSSNNNYVSTTFLALSHFHDSLARKKFLAPFYRWRDRDVRRLNQLLKVILPKRSKFRI